MPYIIIVSIVIAIIAFLICFFLRRNIIYKKTVREQEQYRLETERDPKYQQIVTDLKILVTLVTSSPESYLSNDNRISIKTRIDNTLEKACEYGIRDGYYGYPEYYILKMAQVDIFTKLNKLNENFIKDMLEKYKDFLVILRASL